MAVVGDSAAAVAQAALSHYDKFEFQAEYELLRTGVQANPRDVTLLWMLMRACHNLGMERLAASNFRDAEAMIREGVEHMKVALTLGPGISEVQKWSAILLGKLSDFLSTTDKIKDAFRIKEHALKAAELDPADASTQHVLGAWCFSVSNVGWVQRRAAALLFAEPPSSTHEEAEGYLLRAQELNPEFHENVLLLGDLYTAMGRYDDAKKWYRVAIELPVHTSKHGMQQHDARKKLAAM